MQAMLYLIMLLRQVVKDSENTANALMALDILSRKAGVFGMIGGQVVDIKNENSQIDIDTLDYINELKTGALIEASMMMGAALAGARENDIKLIEKAGSYIGKAFQIQDDILDVTSTTETLGKKVGSDIVNHKSTYVSLIGLETSQKRVEELFEECLTDVYGLQLNHGLMIELFQIIMKRVN